MRAAIVFFFALTTLLSSMIAATTNASLTQLEDNTSDIPIPWSTRSFPSNNIHAPRKLLFGFFTNVIQTTTSIFNDVVSTAKGVFNSLVYQHKVPEIYEQVPRPPSQSKAIVIGSGFGGAISALRLAQAGVQTTVLERGQDWPIDPWREIHPKETFRDGRGLWQRTSVRTPLVAKYGPTLPVDRFGGILDVTEYDDIEVWRGAGVGGGSKVFTGVMIQPKEEYFNEIFEGRVSYDEMDQVYYPRVREMLNLNPIPDDIYNSKFFAHRRVWDKQAKSVGYTIERPDSIFNWDIIRDEIAGYSRRSAIVGESNMGNSNGAKFDVTQNYLKQAISTGNAAVFPNQKVTKISKSSNGYEVSIEKLNPTGNVIDRYSITSEYLFLAAGSIGTSELLVKAKAEGTIPSLNNEIGRGWGTNGDSILTRSFSAISGLNQAAPCTAAIHDVEGVIPVTVESWYVSGTPLDVGIQGSLGIAFDMENRGYFKYANGKVKLVWPRDGNNKAVDAARRVNNKIANGSPGSAPGVPFLAPDVNADFTAHPLGGAVLDKATDNFGRVKGTDRLYVMDGAVIPGSTGAVNPSLTISALTERNIEQIILHDF